MQTNRTNRWSDSLVDFRQQQKAAKQFAKDWMGRGDEKQDTQAFWLSLLQKVYGIDGKPKDLDARILAIR